MFYYWDEEFLLLIVLLGLWLVVMPIYLLIKTSRLSQEVESLKERLGGRAAVANATITITNNPLPSPQPLQDIPPPTVAYDPVVHKSYEPIPEAEEVDSPFYLWVKQDFLVKVGALLLVLALAWFVSYAFANNWIGPVGRITLGLLFGASVLILGVVRMPKSDSQGAIFTILGSMVVLMTIAAGQFIYQMFAPSIALGMMLLSVVFVTFVSLQYERSSLALSGLISALVAPFLINVSSFDSFLLMTYALGVVLGTLFVVWRLRAESLTLTALLGVLWYTSFAYELDSELTLLFAFIFTGIFFVTNIVSLIRRYTKWVSSVHVMTALITGVYLITMVLAAAPTEWVSAYLVLWALVFAYGSYHVFLRTQNKVPFYIYAAVSVILLGTATAVETEGALLTIMLTLEVFMSILLLHKLAAPRSVQNVALALLLVPGVLTFSHMDSYGWYTSVPLDDFFALIIFTAALIGAGLVRSESEPGELLGSAQKFLYSVAGIYGAIITWLVLHGLLSDMVATMIALIFYSVIGLVLYLTGKEQGDSAVRKAGIVILGFVIIRLLLVDVWELELAWRIVTFLTIGLLFVSTAFLPKRTNTTE